MKGKGGDGRVMCTSQKGNDEAEGQIWEKGTPRSLTQIG
jgi:hypothetical protein